MDNNLKMELYSSQVMSLLDILSSTLALGQGVGHLPVAHSENSPSDGFHCSHGFKVKFYYYCIMPHLLTFQMSFPLQE